MVVLLARIMRATVNWGPRLLFARIALIQLQFARIVEMPALRDVTIMRATFAI